MGDLPPRLNPPDERKTRHLKRQIILDQRQLQERKRIVLSWVFTVAIYAVVILISIIFNWQVVLEMADKSGPLTVKIGNPDAMDLPDVKPENQAESQTAPEPEPEVEPIPETQNDNTDTAVANLSAETKVEPSLQPSSKPSSKPSLRPSIKPVKSRSPSRTPTASATPGPQSSFKPLLSPLPNTPIGELKLPRGHDNGNSYETSFFNVKGSVGRVGGTPISQYMPLPRLVLGAVHDNIGQGKLKIPSAARQLEVFEKAYVQTGNNWQLRYDNVPLGDRDMLWAILEGAGYDLRKAEYKFRHLNTVILEFDLSVPSAGRGVEVKNIRVVQSSGDGSIDDAVVFGFRTVAAFSNPTKEEVKGRYSYSFE